MSDVTVERLHLLWPRQKDLLKDNGDLTSRFDRVENAVKELEELEVRLDDSTKAVVNDVSTNLTFGWFGPNDDNVLDDNGKRCYENVRGRLTNEAQQQYHKCAWDLVAGWKEDHKPDPLFRIISNTVTSENDDGTLTCGGVCMAPNQNFASNNYFFQFSSFLRQCKGQAGTGKELIASTKLVLTWLDKLDSQGNVDLAREKSSKALLKRFPLKFLWMWANRESYIPVLSLMEMRELTKLIQGISDLQSFDPVNAEYDEFVQQWPRVSNALREHFPRQDASILETAKFLAVCTLGLTPLRNALDLLKAGNQTLILTGAPGTGKTSGKEACRRLV